MTKDFRMIDTPLYLAIAKADITRAAYKVLLIVIHFTIGYHKEEADISLATYQEGTGLAETSVSHAIHELENKYMIKTTRHSTRKIIYSLNTHFEQWQTSSVHAGKTSSVVVPAKSTIYIDRYKITLKDRVEKGDNGDGSLERGNGVIFNDGANGLDGADCLK